MSFTRYCSAPGRVKKDLQQSTGLGRYLLDTPGPGVNLPFYEDPQLRLQKWGANLQTNTVNLENDLRGMTRKLNRDTIDDNNYKKYAVSATQPSYPSADSFVEESRVSHPAWMFRDLEHSRWEKPWLNPQNNLEKGFHDNIQTRILEKDSFVAKPPIVYGQDTYSGSFEYHTMGQNPAARFERV